MFHGIVEPKELAPNERFPSLLMMIIVSPKDKVNDIDDCSFDDDSADDVSDHDFGAC